MRSAFGHALVLALALSVGATTAGRAQDAASGDVPIPAGTIGGVVLDAASGKPASGAVVTLASQGLVSPGPPRFASVGQVTDASGRFLFTRLPEGDFAITASKLGYFDGGYGRAVSGGPSRRITLHAGETFRDAAIKMFRQTSITGTVIDEAGEPVVGVWVEALGRTLIAGEGQWVSGPVTKTDDRGVYRLAGLTPGPWIVMVPSVQGAVPAGITTYALAGRTPEDAESADSSGRPTTIPNDPSLALSSGYDLLLRASPVPPPAANGRPRSYPITFAPAARLIAEASIIDTSASPERAGVDVRLMPVPVFTVSGVADGPADGPAGFVIRLVPVGNESLGNGAEVATSVVSADGTFTFLNVPPGAYTILASRSVAGYSLNPMPLLMTSRLPLPAGMLRTSMEVSMSAPGGVSLFRETQSGDLGLSGTARLTVPDADVTGVLLSINRGLSISGHVVRDQPKADDITSDVRVPRVTVSADPAGGEAYLPRSSARVDPDDAASTFMIEGLQEGNYLLRVSGAGQVKSITRGGRDYTYRPFDTSGGADITDVVVTLTTETAALAGVVHDRLGRPVSSSAVAVCVPVERDQWSRYGSQPVRLRTIPVEADGAYRFATLPAGDYYVFAVDDEHADVWKDPARLESMVAFAMPVSVTWGSEKRQDVTLVRVP